MKIIHKTTRFSLLVVLALSFGGGQEAMASWADAMGEGSGVDRGSMVHSGGAGTSGSKTTNQVALPDEAALRASLADSALSNIASSFDYSQSVAQTFHGPSAAVAIQSVAAEEDDDGFGEL